MVTAAEELSARLSELGARIGIDPGALPGLVPNGEARPFLLIDRDGSLHWRVDEAGQTLDDRSTADPDELLYWVFRAVTAVAAADWERARRTPGEDSRRARWRRQYDLLARLDPDWARRWRSELAADLRAAGSQADLALLPEPPGER